MPSKDSEEKERKDKDEINFPIMQGNCILMEGVSVEMEDVVEVGMIPQMIQEIVEREAAAREFGSRSLSLSSTRSAIYNTESDPGPR